MDRGIALLVMAVAGALVAMQPPINARLGDATGSILAAAISFAIGTIALVVLAGFVDGFGRLGEVRNVGLVYLTGGLIGAVFVTSSLIVVRTLGAGGVAAATIAAQLSASVAVDQLGILGVEKQSITVPKLLGVLLLIAGTFLIVRE